MFENAVALIFEGLVLRIVSQAVVFGNDFVQTLLTFLFVDTGLLDFSV